MLKFIILLLVVNVEVDGKQYSEELESFFEYVIHHTTIGYSLCGDKPVAVECLPSLAKSPSLFMAKIFFDMPSYHILWRGAQCWDEQSQQLLSANYLMMLQDNILFFINKRAAVKVIEENLDLFHLFLGNLKSSKELLEELCYCPKAIVFSGNPVLAGILYGYGRKNR